MNEAQQAERRAARHLIEHGAFLAACKPDDAKQPRTSRSSDLAPAPWTQHRDEGALKPALDAWFEGKGGDDLGVFAGSVKIGESAARAATVDIDLAPPDGEKWDYWPKRLTDLLGHAPLVAAKNQLKPGHWHLTWLVSPTAGGARDKDGVVKVDGARVGEVRWSLGCKAVTRFYPGEVRDLARVDWEVRQGKRPAPPVLDAREFGTKLGLLNGVDGAPRASTAHAGSPERIIRSATEGNRHPTIAAQAARAGLRGDPIEPLVAAARDVLGGREDGERTVRQCYEWGAMKAGRSTGKPLPGAPEPMPEEQALEEEEQSEILVQVWKEGEHEAAPPNPPPARGSNGAKVDPPPEIVLSEKDMARWIRSIATDNMRYQDGAGAWFVWENGWRQKRALWVLSHLQDAWNGVLNKQVQTKQGPAAVPDPIREGNEGFGARVMALLSQLDGVCTEVGDWDAHPDELGLPGGRKVTISTGAVSDQDMLDLISHSTRHPPAPLEGTRFERFLEEAFPVPHTRLAAQVALGAALGIQPGAYTTVFQGRERSGKTTIQTACTDILGSYAGTLSTALIGGEADPFTRVSARAGLQGLRQAWISETSDALTLADDAFKALGGGGDKVTARGIGKDSYSFDATHDLFVVTNHLPYLRRRDPAIIDRMRIVPMDQTRPAGERENLTPLFRDHPAEAGAVLAWLLEGYRLWLRRGDCPASPEMDRRKEAWLDSCDPLGAFVREELVEGGSIRLRELGREMRAWCRERGMKLPSYLATTQALNGQAKTAGLEVRIGRGNCPELVGHSLPKAGEDA